MAMTEKKFDTRILLKYDSLENWNSSSLILKAGEVAIATVPTTESTTVQSGIITPPAAVIIKVGDGESTFAQLPVVSGLAADVYSWAKKDEVSFVKWLDETKGFATDAEVTAVKTALEAKDKALQDAIDLLAGGGEPGSQGGLAEVYVRVTELETILSSFLPEGDAAATLDAVKNAIDAIDAKIGARKNGEVAASGVYADIEAIEGRVGALEGADVAFESRVAENERKLAGVGAGETVKGLISVVSGEVATVAGDLDKVEAKLADVEEGKTVGALISAAETAAKGHADTEIGKVSAAVTALENGQVKLNKEAIELLNADDKTEGSVDYKVAQEVAKILNDADSSDIDTLEEIASWIINDTTGAAGMAKDIAALKSTTEGHGTTIGQHTAAISEIEGDIETLNSGLTALSNTVTGMTGEAGVITLLEGRVKANEDAIEALQEKDIEINGQIVALQGLVAGNTTAIETEKGRAEAAEASLLEKVNAAQSKAESVETTLTAALNAEIERATKKETALEGSISALDSSLAAVAKSGNIADLTQTEEIILDCGSSAARVYTQA